MSHEKQAAHERATNLSQHFWLLMMILTVQTVILGFMARKLSIDVMPWTFYWIAFTIINLIISTLYILVTKITKAYISYRYTITLGIILITFIVIEAFCYYYKIYHITDTITYSTYAIFIFIHLCNCLQKRIFYKKIGFTK